MPTKTAAKAPETPSFPDDALVEIGAGIEVIGGEPTADEPPLRWDDLDPRNNEDGMSASSALVPLPPTNSVIVGLGALAAMTDEEYEAKKLVMKRGLERVKDIQQTLMTDKEDYGKVRGIERPFLHLPGAEKLANFYGYAVRQEAERLAGDGVTTPPLAYHVKSFVHLGDFSGPVVAMGYGEANSWEEKYRWRNAKAACPTEKGGCGREGLVRGRADGPLKGKWWCPGKDGGCNKKWEPGDVPPPGKVENTDPHGLAETLIQMAGKRSFVASIRRATGTSGLFTQDEDSPSVQQQAAASGEPDATEPVVTAGPVGVAVPGVGAKTDDATELQLARLSRLSKEKGLNGAKIAELLARLFDMEVEPTGKAASDAVKTLNAQQVGQLLYTIETGEVPETKESLDADLAAAMIPDDIGAK